MGSLFSKIIYSPLLVLILLTATAYANAVDPAWAELSSEQKKVLTPLAGEWNTLRPWQREKMLDIARDYPKMQLDQQKLVQKRLEDWSRLTPYERENARKRHQQFQTFSPDKKQLMRKKWQEYQSLTEDQKQNLRKSNPDFDKADDL